MTTSKRFQGSDSGWRSDLETRHPSMPLEFLWARQTIHIVAGVTGIFMTGTSSKSGRRSERGKILSCAPKSACSGLVTIKPLVYKRLGPKTIRRISQIMKASFLLGVMPACFKELRVVFIPKNNKPSFDNPKAFRPISLMNYFMKIMEKIILWRMEDVNLKLSPLQREQHGFMKAKSCDSALTVALSYLEYPLMRNEFAVMALLDFEAAYD